MTHRLGRGPLRHIPRFLSLSPINSLFSKVSFKDTLRLAAPLPPLPAPQTYVELWMIGGEGSPPWATRPGVTALAAAGVRKGPLAKSRGLR